MNEELRLWTVGKSGEVEPLSSVEEMHTEVALEDLLVQNPEMLEPDLTLVGRQTPTKAGRLDLLAVDQDGRLVVYELKRGTLVREAVTQVLDYASALDAMDFTDLTKHIAEHSGHDGIQRIDDFEQWYADDFGGGDLSRLLPPRMVLIGLGVDRDLERMVRFISRGSVDISVATFQCFMSGEDRLLARQMDVQPGGGQPEHRGRSKTVAERRQDLREYLAQHDYEDLFGKVHHDLRSSLPERGVWEEPRATGISIQLTEPDNPGRSKTYFGVYAGHDGSAVYTVSILQEAIRRGGEAIEEVKKSINLTKWPYGPGGLCFSFESEEEWVERRPAVLEFVESVMENRDQAQASREPE